jgi:hypothetical protein
MVLALALGLALVAGGCGSSSNPTTGGVADNGTCEHWCGNGSARVTVGGVTATISGGGCYDAGAAGIDARFGDWGNAGIGDYVTVSGYRVGGPTPTPAPTVAALAVPSATGHLNVAVDANVAGQPVVLDTDATVTFAADGTGSFSGTDLNGSGKVSGTFNCS